MKLSKPSPTSSTVSSTTSLVGAGASKSTGSGAHVPGEATNTTAVATAKNAPPAAASAAASVVEEGKAREGRTGSNRTLWSPGSLGGSGAVELPVDGFDNGRKTSRQVWVLAATNAEVGENERETSGFHVFFFLLLPGTLLRTR